MTLEQRLARLERRAALDRGAQGRSWVPQFVSQWYRRVLEILAFLAAVLVFVSGVVGQGEVRAIRGKIQIVKVPYGWQYPQARPSHPVDETMLIGGNEIPVKRSGKRVIVAKAPGDRPSYAVKSGSKLEFRWDRNGKRWKSRIAFVSRSASKLEYFRADARSHRIGTETILIFDTNCDGRFNEFGKDGFAAYGQEMIAPLVKQLVVGLHRVEIQDLSEDGMTLRVRMNPIGASRSQLEALRTMNVFRARYGLLPVDLSEALSKGASEHELYLRTNNWPGNTNPHDQVADAAGATKAGAEAARQSVIRKANHAGAIDAFDRSFYHRGAIMAPDLRRIGISDPGAEVSVIDVHDCRPASGVPRHPNPVLVPCEGATGFPSRFSEGGEKPHEPVPNCAARGNPLMLCFDPDGGKVTEFRGRLMEVARRREKAVEVQAAAPRDYYYLRGIVPTMPLKSTTTYVARYHYKLRGKRHEISVRFRTE